MSPKRYVWMLTLLLALLPASMTYAAAAKADFWESMVERSKPRPAAAPPQAYEVSEEERGSPPSGPAGRPPRLDPPSILRIIIEESGKSRLEGRGTPGSEVVVSLAGRNIARVMVGASGTWTATLDRALTSGDHDIASLASGAAGVRYGDEVRLSLPENLRGLTIVENGSGNETGSISETSAAEADLRQRAEDLARAASERFTEIEGSSRRDAGSGKVRVSQAPAKPEADQPSLQPAVPDLVTPVYDWLEQSARDYQGGIVPKLSVPPDAASAVPKSQALNPSKEPAPSAGQTAKTPGALESVRNWLDAARDSYQREIAKPLSEAPPAAAEAARKDVAPRAEQVPVIVPPVRDKPSAPFADRTKTEAERKAEARRRADAEAEAFVSERRRVDEARRLARARAAEEAKREAADLKRREDEARRAAADAEIKAREEKRKAEAERLKAGESRKLAEAERLIAERKARKAAEDQAKKAAVAQRLAEKQRLEEERAEAARQSEAERQEEARLVREAEARRLAEERERRAAEKLAKAQTRSPERRTAEPQPRMTIATESQSEAAGEVEMEVRGGMPSTEIIIEEGSALGEEEAASEARPQPRRKISREARSARSAARTKAWRKRQAVKSARQCRKTSKACRGGLTHTVRPGESLWAIANRYYCTGERYDTLIRANRRRIADPDRIFPSMRIIVPRRRC